MKRMRRHPGGGSLHSTATAMEPPWKRMRPKGNTRSSTGGDGGGGSQHSGSGSQDWTATTRLLFADAGYYHKELKRHLIANPRQELDESVREEIKEVVEEFEPDIYVVPTLIKTTKTVWEVVAKDWDRECMEFIQLRKVNASLYAAYDGCLTTLRRLTPCKQQELKLFLVRIPKCKQDNTFYCVSQADRADIANNIFAVLAKEKAPCIVIGNLGFAIASLMSYLLQFQRETGMKLQEQLQIVCSEDQQLVCIFKYEAGQSIQRKNSSGTPGCLWIDISWSGSVVSQHAAQTGGMSSGGTHPSDHTKRVDVTLKSRRERYLKLLTTAENDKDRRGRLATLLLRPVVSSTGVIDVNATLEMLDKSFDLLKKAREQAGVKCNNKTLNKAEFKVAHDWLFDTFKNHFMQNVDLKDRMHHAAQRYDVLSRRTKRKLRKDMRGAFKTWKHTLLGNHPFLMAVLRNGLFDSKSQRELMIAVLQEQSNSGGDHPAEHDRKEHRRKALEARQRLKNAKKLASKVASGDLPESELSTTQIRLLRDYDLGKLKTKREENDNAYGHGEGVQTITKEEAAVFRMSCKEIDDELDAYFHR